MNNENQIKIKNTEKTSSSHTKKKKAPGGKSPFEYEDPNPNDPSNRNIDKNSGNKLIRVVLIARVVTAIGLIYLLSFGIEKLRNYITQIDEGKKTNVISTATNVLDNGPSNPEPVSLIEYEIVFEITTRGSRKVLIKPDTVWILDYGESIDVRTLVINLHDGSEYDGKLFFEYIILSWGSPSFKKKVHYTARQDELITVSVREQSTGAEKTRSFRVDIR